MQTPTGLEQADWDYIYEIGSHIHQRLHQLWNSAAAVYAKDGQQVRIAFTVEEGGVKLRYPLDVSIGELRQNRDGEALANLIIATFKRSLESDCSLTSQKY